MSDSNKPIRRSREIPLGPLTPTLTHTLNWSVDIVGTKLVPKNKRRISDVDAKLQRAHPAFKRAPLVAAPPPNPPPRPAPTEAESPTQLLAAVRDLLVRTLQTSATNEAVSQPPAKVEEKKSKRKYTRKQPAPVVTPVELKDRNWLTFQEAAALYPPSEQAFRRIARQCEQYLKDPKAGLPSNGFEHCIVRVPNSRRVYLDAVQLDLWMASGRVSKGSRPT